MPTTSNHYCESGVTKMDKPVKKTVEELLRKRDFQDLLELCEKNRHYWQEVRFRLYDLDESAQMVCHRNCCETHEEMVAFRERRKSPYIYQDPFLVDER